MGGSVGGGLGVSHAVVALQEDSWEEGSLLFCPVQGGRAVVEDCGDGDGHGNAKKAGTRSWRRRVLYSLTLDSEQ